MRYSIEPIELNTYFIQDSLEQKLYLMFLSMIDDGFNNYQIIVARVNGVHSINYGIFDKEVLSFKYWACDNDNAQYFLTSLKNAFESGEDLNNPTHLALNIGFELNGKRITYSRQLSELH